MDMSESHNIRYFLLKSAVHKDVSYTGKAVFCYIICTERNNPKRPSIFFIAEWI